MSNKKKYKKPEPGTAGYNLMIARKEAGLTQEELADILGISRTMMVQYEHNEAQMRMDIIIKLLDTLDESFENIFMLHDPLGEHQEISAEDILKQKAMRFVLVYQELLTGTYKGSMTADED